jgi:hypothetical protein
MPDLKNKLDKLLSEAAECQMIGSLAADAAKRAAYRERADQFRDLAEQVRAQISAGPRRNIEFLLEQAGKCRKLVAELDNADIKADLLMLAAELEQTAKREREDG